MTSVSGVLLAAGESRRMGEVNKLALPVAGQPLLRRTALLLMKLPLRELIVVTGHDAGTTHSLLAGLPVQTVHNAHFRDGQMSSVHAGLGALRVSSDAVLVCLADLPLLELDDLQRLIGAYREGETSVLVPMHRGQRGNPILLANQQREQILAGNRNLGCKRLIQNNPDMVTAVEMDNDHTVFDLDTPAAYCRLQARLAMPNATQAYQHSWG